tara:strand:- start:5663 stop:5995 length:333 start_codon:yes stop_codon:yes gene_type:complete
MYGLIISLLLLGAPDMHDPTWERADVRSFERYDAGNTCIFNFYSPKILKKYEVWIKPKWRKYRHSRSIERLVIIHPICNDRNWYAHGGMYETHTMNKYLRKFGAKFKKVN